jgi:uncharacterized delta-60 repeat protein
MARRIRSAWLVLLVSALIPLMSAPRALAGAGDLDSTFSGNGKLTTEFPSGESEAFAVAIQPDRKIVVAGDADDEFALARYNTDGSRDSTFGIGGKVETGFPGFIFAEAEDVAVQTDGKIVAAGDASDGTNEVFAVARYGPDGNLDTTFSGDGLQTTDLSSGLMSSKAHAVALQGDGKIVVAGDTDLDTELKSALARYNPDGTLDTTFSGNGKFVPRHPACYARHANDFAIQPNGKIVIAGDCERTGLATYLARILPDGHLDKKFSGNGWVLGPSIVANSVALQDDGKIVAVGGIFSFSRFAALRFRPNGSIDLTFSGNGLATITFEAPAGAGGVAIQSNGKIVLAGDEDSRFALTRLSPGGRLNLRFGGGDGRVTTRIGRGASGADVAIVNGKIVVVGSAEISGASRFAAARYLVG